MAIILTQTINTLCHSATPLPNKHDFFWVGVCPFHCWKPLAFHVKLNTNKRLKSWFVLFWQRCGTVTECHPVQEKTTLWVHPWKKWQNGCKNCAWRCKISFCKIIAGNVLLTSTFLHFAPIRSVVQNPHCHFSMNEPSCTGWVCYKGVLTSF